MIYLVKVTSTFALGEVFVPCVRHAKCVHYGETALKGRCDNLLIMRDHFLQPFLEQGTSSIESRFFFCVIGSAQVLQ